jgi:hypothetical protein
VNVPLLPSYASRSEPRRWGSAAPGCGSNAVAAGARRLLLHVYSSTLEMVLRQTAPAARGRQLPPGPLPPGDTSCARPDPHTPEGHSLPPAPASLVYPHTLIHFRAYAVGRWRANAIKRQTESCHTRVSEDTGTLFTTLMWGTSCGSECPLTPEKKADKTGHAPTGPPPTQRRPTPCTTSPYTSATMAADARRPEQGLLRNVRWVQLAPGSGGELEPRQKLEVLAITVQWRTG